MHSDIVKTFQKYRYSIEIPDPAELLKIMAYLDNWCMDLIPVSDHEIYSAVYSKLWINSELCIKDFFKDEI